MIKNKLQFQIKKDERIYEFFLDPESPLGEVFDVLSQFRQYIIEKIKEEESKIEKNEDKQVKDGK